MRKIIVPAVLLLLVLAVPAGAGIAVGVKVGVPRLVLQAPPVLVVVPGTYVYAAPDVDADLVFYQGYWYRPYGGQWYRSGDYNGAWVAVPPPSVPVPVRNLPPNWKQVPPGHERMPYGHVKKNWHSWEREKHWERSERRGSGRAVGVGVEGRPAPARGSAVGTGVEGRPGPGSGAVYEKPQDKRGGKRYEDDHDRRGKKGKKDKKGKRRNGDDDDDDDDRYEGRGRRR